jgi:hypothetical protein
MRSGSVIAASDTVAGSARDRGFVPGLHLEPDATGAVRLEDDFTVTKNPRAQIDRRAIEDDTCTGRRILSSSAASSSYGCATNVEGGSPANSTPTSTSLPAWASPRAIDP